MAKIILINPYPKYAKGTGGIIITPPLGLAYLAAAVKKNNHEVQIIDANILGISPERIAGSFKFKPDLIGISVNIVNYKAAIDCVKHLKRLYQNTPIVLGGPYPSSLAQSILDKIPDVDAVVIGEGENTLVEITESLGKENIFPNIKGVVYRYQDKIIHNKVRPLIKNLDDISFPAYALLPNLRQYRTRSRGWPVGYIITSRGCSSQCTFCNKNIFGTSWRPHSANRVIDEICYLVKQYGIKQLDILDDNFTSDINRAEEILERLAKIRLNLYINLQYGIRVDISNKDLLFKMKKAGVFKIAFGIETANQDIQKKIKKPIELEKAIGLVRTARSLGIVTYGFFMVGLPGETAKTMEETIRFSLKMNPHFVFFSICIPFPGTEIFEEIEKKGEFLEKTENGIDYGFFGNRVFFKSLVSSQETISYFKRAYKKFYMRISKIIDILLTIKSINEFKWLIRSIKRVHGWI